MPDRLLRPVGALLALSLLTSCHDARAPSRWTGAPITVDGKNQDWSDIPFTELDDTGMSLGICNDAENVYIAINARIPRLLHPASGKGFTTWFDKSGKKTKDFGIRYIGNPISNPDSTWGGRPEFGGASRPGRPMPGAHQPVIEQLLVLFKPGESGINLKLDGSAGPAAKLDNLNGVFTCELSVPLNYADKGPYVIGAEAGSQISIGIEVGGAAAEPTGGGRRGGMPRDGQRDMPPRDGMGGRPPPGRRDAQLKNPATDDEIWISYTLATESSGE